MAEIVIGVLALQGDFAEHIATLKKCGDVKCREVRKLQDLEGTHGLVIPGGESTVILKLLRDFKLFEHVKAYGSSGIPMFGTCAGCIMLSSSIDGMPEQETLRLGDYSVKRNAYGAQVHSFESHIKGDPAIFGEEPLRAILIRAPMITKCGPNFKILAEHEGHPVLVQQDNILSCTFHPEITGDARIHKYFVELVKQKQMAYKS
ncbi:hypothetical protein GUITHDRAFT_152484 [Guillardia theta CCMP2712]|uniref:glutaminase n=2 Tax=Guillardia theta TaxID=55529 RepID=L1JCU8_GUITC|nr:hypothetical protein GUITHDRAFT_152484 [Guillardia theta CCMP2712]EKX46353.1 hypothetical protein GUITHDRAFT_152484 [Guillardia theta CCMP2712]|mmetsp:Transcript_50247/g.157032  ORF Transcript_50247/g.157032 Transcript_50247/m.157032 type:complete len:204 (+) Transcript_50247:93-704(+)|eukprot:XP_005833333.1 hypothetical protein GUITHDRAFT_152484 [Guillardia theta CCMP2712]